MSILLRVACLQNGASDGVGGRAKAKRRSFFFRAVYIALAMQTIIRHFIDLRFDSQEKFVPSESYTDDGRLFPCLRRSAIDHFFPY
jgi:hypothetical protein